MQAITIERAVHDKDHPYTMISKSFCEDMSISMELKSLLLYCFSRTNNWVHYVSQLASVHKICYRKCLKLLDEGIKAGYIQREQMKNGNLNCGIKYFFSENKCFSNNVTDMHENDMSKELFEKYKALEEKNQNSKNVTGVSCFRHAEKVNLRINNTILNTERNEGEQARRNVQKTRTKNREIPKFLEIKGLSKKDQQILANQFSDSELIRALEDTESYHKNKEKVKNIAAFITQRAKSYRDKSK